jgi:ribosomal protein S18 acetylase RimI-like enzyme
MVAGQIAERDQARALYTLVLAFAGDPVERWLYPEPQQYLTFFPRFLAAFGGRAFTAGTAWSAGGLDAVALWLPPGTGADGDAIVAALSGSVAASQHEETFAVLGQIDEAHPRFPHWYLPWLGVDPARQGHGLGGDLLAHGLERVDADRLPAYLETPNPRTVPLYERHGFEVTGQTQSPTCPPITFMLRHAR